MFGRPVPGNRYEITSAGDTDFTTVGASASSVGEVFVATAADLALEATYLVVMRQQGE